MGADMSFLAHDALQSPASRHGPQARFPGRADLVNLSFDDPGGLSRLNPVVQPRLPGPKLTELRCPPVVAVPNAEPRPVCVCCEREREIGRRRRGQGRSRGARFSIWMSARQIKFALAPDGDRRRTVNAKKRCRAPRRPAETWLIARAAIFGGLWKCADLRVAPKLCPSALSRTGQRSARATPSISTFKS